MTPLIKICGIKKFDDVRVAEKNGASWYGLVFYKKSPRNISLNDAKKIVSKSAKSILPVAVTVNPDEFFIKQLIKIGINNIQLHGNETLEYCLFLKNKFNVKIIKGIGLETEKDIRLAEKYSKIVDWIIFDKKDLAAHGGTGESFDWKIFSNKISQTF